MVGKGFTEWSNLKNAEPHFEGHSIIKTPTWGQYDLSNPEMLSKQFKYARQIGVDVFLYTTTGRMENF